MELLLELDKNLFLLINQSGIEFLDPIMLFITNKLSSIPIYLFLIYLIFKKKKKQSVLILLSILTLIILTDQGSVQLFKNTIERLRPCHFLEEVRLVKEHCGGQYGFISSHAANTFGLTFFISKIFKNRQLFIFLFCWAAIVSFSRIYIGVHYPVDLLGGAIWGVFMAFISFKIYSIIYKKYV